MSDEVDEILAELRAISKTNEEYADNIRMFLARRHMGLWDFYEMQRKYDKMGIKYNCLVYCKYATYDGYQDYLYVRERDYDFIKKGELENYRTLKQQANLLRRREERIRKKQEMIRG